MNSNPNMNEKTSRILNRILLLLSNYRLGETNLAYLVDSLDGSLGALEEKLPDEWRDRWSRKMIELDTYRALGLEMERKSDILENLKQLTRLIQEINNSEKEW
jgi:hypothetical protein